MRLIDADALDDEIMYFFMAITGNPKQTTVVRECKSSFRKIINEQPTAYDVDKVVEQLEEKVELAYRRYMDCPSYSPCFVRYQSQYQERKMCLEIVKAGGVNE